MLGLKPDLAVDATVLCLGAHCDDIEIGCGATLMELQQRYPTVNFLWVVFSGDEIRAEETRAAATRVHNGSQRYRVEIQQFSGSYFPYCGAQIKDSFEALRKRVAPELIFSHFRGDRHQDHRVIAELTWNTFRNHLILEYEIPKYEGDLAHPNLYVPIGSANVERKLHMLMECFPSQHSRTWFDTELFRGHMRLRGVECNAPSKYAEAFHACKLVL